MPTIADFMADIKETLGLNIDDAEWSDGALAYNIGLAIDHVKVQDLNRSSRRGDEVANMSEVSRFVVPLSTDDTYGMRYFDMPGPVYDLPHNGGIDHIAYYRLGLPANCPPQVARVQYSPTTWKLLPLIQHDPLQRPSEERPRYIRERNKTWVIGQSPQITSVQMGLYLSFPPLSNIDINEEINLAPQLLFNVRRMVLQSGNWLMLQPQERLLNDGRANNVGTETRPTPPIMSINDQVLNPQPD